MFSQSLACKTHIGHKTDYDIEGLGLVSRSFTSLNIKASPFAKIYIVFGQYIVMHKN